jgi:MFS family permease
LFIPLFGRLSDIMGRRLVVGFGFVVLAATGFPFFALIQPGWPLGLWIGLLLANGLALAAVFAPIATLLAELLPSSYRYSGLALSRETGNAIGAAVIPPMAVVLSSDGATTTLSVVLIALAALGMLGLLALPRLGNQEPAQQASGSGTEPPARPVEATVAADEQPCATRAGSGTSRERRPRRDAAGCGPSSGARDGHSRPGRAREDAGDRRDGAAPRLEPSTDTDDPQRARDVLLMSSTP